MPQRKVSGAATHQEPPGAAIVPQDGLTYAPQHAAFFASIAPRRFSPTRNGAAAHTVDGHIEDRSVCHGGACVLLRRPQCGLQLQPGSTGAVRAC